GAYDANARNNDGTTGKYRFFNLNMPLRVGYTLRNDGNVAESPVGSITLQNLFGGSEVVINDMNPNKSLALIGQTRTFVTCIKRASQEVDFEGTRQDAVV